MSGNEVWQRGYNAYMNEEDLESNPYQKDGNFYNDWEAGWCAAMNEVEEVGDIT